MRGMSLKADRSHPQLSEQGSGVPDQDGVQELELGAMGRYKRIERERTKKKMTASGGGLTLLTWRGGGWSAAGWPASSLTARSKRLRRSSGFAAS